MTLVTPAAATLLAATFAVVSGPTSRFEPVARPTAEARSDAAASAPRAETGATTEAAEKPPPRA